MSEDMGRRVALALIAADENKNDRRLNARRVTDASVPVFAPAEMREAVFILPEDDNAGRSLIFKHQELQRLICERWGGFTVISAKGGWKAPNCVVHMERVQVYHIAMPDNAENADKLRKFAVTAGLACDQQSVHVRYASGLSENIQLAEKE